MACAFFIFCFGLFVITEAEINATVIHQKAYCVPDPLLLGFGNVPVTRRPASCQECSLHSWFLTRQLIQDHVPFAVYGGEKGTSTQTWTPSVVWNCDEL